MNRDYIEKKVLDVLKESLSLTISIDEIRQATSFDDLGLDSFSRLEMVFELEGVFDVELTDEMIGDLKNFDDLVDMLEKTIINSKVEL